MNTLKIPLGNLNLNQSLDTLSQFANTNMQKVVRGSK